jgi:nitrite reductase (NADH) large subunit
MSALGKKKVVVIGNGMVGYKFCEKLIAKTAHKNGDGYRIVTFCEEPRPAYDRVNLTKYFSGTTAEELLLAKKEWYEHNGIELRLGDRAASIMRHEKRVISANGESISYDKLVIATGSYPFVPQVPGINMPGVFVYRTIEDLEAIIAYAKHSKKAAVIGGGLLGLEAAKAVYDLGMETHVVEFAPKLMPRQLDEGGSEILVKQIEALGVKVHLNKNTSHVGGEDKVTGLHFKDGTVLDLDMIVVSAGIKPRDELGKSSALQMGERGGIQVDNYMLTSDPDIYAIGEVALHRGMIYGLVAPGYEMAEVAACHIVRDGEKNEEKEFLSGDLSSKLKLMGVDVASLGDAFGATPGSVSIVLRNDVVGVYKRIVVSADKKTLLGAILVGDANEYGKLLQFIKNASVLPPSPEDLILGSRGGEEAELEMSEAAQVCSCNNVSKGAVISAIKDGCVEVGAIKSCTKAGTGCGGCIPLVTDILKAELKKQGKQVSRFLCEHFAYSRQELFQIVKVKKIRSFNELLENCGTGAGCEICKPAVASILASTWNEIIMKHNLIQDTNDRFLANIQRGGTYSVIPRVPGGEITPDKLIVLGTVAKKYGLYCKITGGQRIDLLGARVDQLPDIWEDLIEGGFESGHAYGKALRTVKSCVGSTWCRYGVQDSTAFAIRIEERYKGMRSPHKLKGAVSGCVRECAEAQSKDFGVIATEKGWNLYVCGNGGAKPQHAVLLASDIDSETCIRYLDRFLMYYIHTADRLTRTAPWFNQIEGGLDTLKKIIIEDSLGICEQLEKDIQHLIDTYQCEWKEAVQNPEKRAIFRHFVNTDEKDTTIQWIEERGQKRPADWA